MSGGTLPPSKPTEDKIKVLIVDDIPETRENLRKLLFFESDIEVVGAAVSGEEGIDMAADLKPDVVLMDINMPGIDGIAASEEITKRAPFTQIIMMSVQGEADYLRRSMLAGAREFLIKPFSSDELVSSIRRVYELGATRRQAMPVAAPGQAAAPALHKDAGLGKVIAVFSPKGGVGCSTIAINMAVALQLRNAGSVGVLDAGLQFGDVAVLLNVQPKRTIADIAQLEEFDAELIPDVLIPHSSGIKTLLAPPDPTLADYVTADMMGQAVKKMRRLFDFCIVDMWSALHEVVLTVLEASDRILLVTTPEIPAIKNAKLFLELTDALEYPPGKTLLVLNKTDRRTNIRAEDIEKSIKYKIVAQLPLEELTATLSINQGVPFVLSKRDSELANAVFKLADFVVDNLKPKEEEEKTEDAGKAALGRIFG